MYLIVIAWIYVVLMMSVAEASNSNGSILGALITFVLYGAAPVSLAVYLMGAPRRSKALKKREAEARAAYLAGMHPDAQLEAASSVQPDAGGHAAGSAETVTADTRIAPVGKKS
jgi:hypothetical protein